MLGRAAELGKLTSPQLRRLRFFHKIFLRMWNFLITKIIPTV